MTTELIRQLRAWGFHMSGGRVEGEQRPSAADHPIERAREFAPMTRERAARLLAGRDGNGRRKIMAQAINATSKYPDIKTVRIAPAWASDPIRCKETRSRTGAYVAPEAPDELKWVDQVLAQISRQSPVRAMVLREEFVGDGSQRRKAARVAMEYGGRLSVWQYRRELQRALDWISGTRAVK